MKKKEPIPKEELRGQFNRTGLRFTPQREAVWRVFESDPAGLSISQATAILTAQGIGQATVYRTIKALQNLGYLKWVHDQGGDHRFVASRPGHRHLLVCRSCSKAVECGDCDLAVMEKLIAMQTGFAIEGHHLEFFGSARSALRFQARRRILHCALNGCPVCPIQCKRTASEVRELKSIQVAAQPYTIPKRSPNTATNLIPSLDLGD